MRGRRDVLGLLGWIGLTALAAVARRLASPEAESFYTSFAKPDWAPPVWLFRPVWIVLYLMIAVAAWLVWRHGQTETGSPTVDLARQTALRLFVLQLALNALWAWLFFAWHAGGAALIEIVVLWILITTTLIAFWRVQRLAGLLMVPYLLWMTFASALNAAIWSFNRGHV